ncbi:hypothetical protein MTR67_018672 [Solanum verrucosum]|uniref:Uncharacterized protein n=1 Tax=Solanum verrucosum TaxID=315347 RepID=A0AAF0QK38_SOLVR|nr:hypothetical protein MTR67_018672 [Solanum verrucosum]
MLLKLLDNGAIMGWRLALGWKLGFKDLEELKTLDVTIRRVYATRSEEESQSHVSGSGLGNINGDSGVERVGASKPKMRIDEAFSYFNLRQVSKSKGEVYHVPCCYDGL